MFLPLDLHFGRYFNDVGRIESFKTSRQGRQILMSLVHVFALLQDKGRLPDEYSI